MPWLTNIIYTYAVLIMLTVHVENIHENYYSTSKYSEKCITFYKALMPNLKTVLLDIHQYS